jgi:hypothetical protein
MKAPLLSLHIVLGLEEVNEDAGEESQQQQQEETDTCQNPSMADRQVEDMAKVLQKLICDGTINFSPLASILQDADILITCTLFQTSSSTSRTEFKRNLSKAFVPARIRWTQTVASELVVCRGKPPIKTLLDFSSVSTLQSNCTINCCL